MSIDLLLEKWLIAFNKYGKTLEVFENPSSKEFKNIKTCFRFILDSKRKKIYVWSAMGAIHDDAWKFINKELNDTRQLYNSDTLLTGTFENNIVYLDALSQVHYSIKNKLIETDWSFATRWIDIKKLNDILDEL